MLGEQITAGEAWHRTLPRLPAMFGATILYFLIIAGLWTVYLGIGVLMAAEHGPTGLIVPYFLLAGILVICLTVWFWTSFILASQIAVLERAGPARALARSWRLVRHSFWRVFGITLLAQLIVGIASAILQVPFSIPAALITSHAGNPLHPPIVAVIIGTVGTIVGRTVTGALLAGVLVLLYVDLRMRREGLDMALRTATGRAAREARQGQVAGTSSPPSGGRRPDLSPRDKARVMGNGDTQVTGVPGIGRQAAQRLARDELSKAMYHPHQSFLRWPLSQAERLLDRLPGGGAGLPGGWSALVALAALVVLVVAVVPRRIGPVARSRRGRTGLLAADPQLTARGHRDQAERYAAAGDYAAAILEYLRAIAAGLEERAVLVPDPGRTAGELAAGCDAQAGTVRL